MTRTSSARFPARLRALARIALLAPLPLLAGGCSDNPACVFSGGCGGGGGGAGELLGAGQPAIGSWILDGAPVLVDHAPSGTAVHPQSPVIVEFSESLAAESLEGALRLVDVTSGAPVPTVDPPGLVGDGRLVVLVPIAPLPADRDFRIELGATAEPRDLTGVPATLPGDRIVGTFRTSSTPPEAPQLLANWPPHESSGQSEITEVVAVFDRRMLPADFDGDSWVTTVDGLPPAVDPQPVPLVLTGAQVAATQVWRWRSVDAAGEPVSLRPAPGVEATVEVVLSPAGAPLRAEDLEPLETIDITFTLAPISAPAAVAKAAGAEPADAIGAPNLQGEGDPVLAVELVEAAVAGDRLHVYLFGEALPPAEGAAALVRTLTLTEEHAGLTTVELTAGFLDLLLEDAPPAARLADGELTVAIARSRGELTTPVRLMDVDPDTAGAQPALLDVTPPELLGLGTHEATTSSFTSPLRGVVVVGRASEELRRVEVRLPALGLDNGPEPEVASSSPDGIFVARPVEGLGLVAPSEAPLGYEVRIFDRALNPAPSVAIGDFRPAGAVAGVLVPGAPLAVQVLDAWTLQPIAGALVVTHRDEAGVYERLAVEASDAAGLASPASAATGLTIVTIEREGYDLFTYHGVAAAELQVLLERSGVQTTTTGGAAIGALPLVDFSDATSYVGDARVPPRARRVFDVAGCTTDFTGLQLRCSFGPDPILVERLGAQSLAAAHLDVPLADFSPASFLEAFTLRVPIAPLPVDAIEEHELVVEALLASLPVAEQAKAVPEHALVLPPGALAGGFGALEGEPLVTVEAVGTGVPGSVLVGLGRAYDPVAGVHPVLGAIPGSVRGTPVDQQGELVRQGTIGADLLMRAEAVDADGNRSGRRRRFSESDGLLALPDVPVLRAPLGSAGGPGFDLVFDDVIEDGASAAGTGLYHAVLTDPLGRRWNLWRADPAGSGGTVALHVPDVEDVATSSPVIATGSLTVGVSAYTWPAFDPTAFMWYDLEREVDLFAHARSVPVQFP